MKAIVLGSGSSGNCYLLKADSGETLIVELGISWPKIKNALDSKYHKVAAIVSHRHVSDHAKSVPSALDRSIPVFAGIDVANAFYANAPDCFIACEDRRIFRHYGFSVAHFPLIHDVPINGFLIHHEECGVICFITDTCYARTADGRDFDFKDVNTWLVESNFDEDILLNRVYKGNLDAYRADRIVKSHFSVQECEKMLRQQDLSESERIVLIHLSDSNSHAKEFKQRIERATGVPTYIAEPGLELDLNLNLWDNES